MLANIYLNKINKVEYSRRSSPEPRDSNPDQDIGVVRRADGSGAFIFTATSKVSDEWKGKVGEGSAVQWPAGPRRQRVTKAYRRSFRAPAGFDRLRGILVRAAEQRMPHAR